MDASAPEHPRNPLNPVVAFMIGLSIILIASILNAAGLNLTKLDHVRTSAIPKSARRKDWMRPLWLLGMFLYIISQLIGSTLALEYMRAEYVAPLGSSSLVFNFLFARFLVGTPVTSTDIYGTIIVILGVIGIVAFGSINSGLTSKTDVEHLTYLWRRGGWLGFFFAMAIALISVYIFTSRLDAVLTARGDIDAPPFSATSFDLPFTRNGSSIGNTRLRGDGVKSQKPVVQRLMLFTRTGWQNFMLYLTRLLEVWTGPKDDKQIAWTLGIGWACCGGGLAGGCLVFAKATVKLLSGSLSKQNPGNQFGHAAPIFTIALLVITAVMQIICLNRGLKVYDSTLVVPVFYGVYTAIGFLDSLIFNDEVDAYQSWTLFLIFASILILVSGVVLLTHKKPEPVSATPPTMLAPPPPGKKRRSRRSKSGQEEVEGGEQDVLWTVGDDSGDEDAQELGTVEYGDGDEDVDHHQNPIEVRYKHRGVLSEVGTGQDAARGKGKGTVRKVEGEEGVGLMAPDGEDEDQVIDRYQHRLTVHGHGPHSSSGSSSGSLTLNDSFRDDVGEEAFGDWEGGGKENGKR